MALSTCKGSRFELKKVRSEGGGISSLLDRFFLLLLRGVVGVVAIVVVIEGLVVSLIAVVMLLLRLGCVALIVLLGVVGVLVLLVLLFALCFPAWDGGELVLDCKFDFMDSDRLNRDASPDSGDEVLLLITVDDIGSFLLLLLPFFLSLNNPPSHDERFSSFGAATVVGILFVSVFARMMPGRFGVSGVCFGGAATVAGGGANGGLALLVCLSSISTLASVGCVSTAL